MQRLSFIGTLPSNLGTRPQADRSNSEFDPLLYNNFMNFLSRQKATQFKRRLFEFYGKNFTINYKDHYNFLQEWQNRQEDHKENSVYELINQISFLGVLVFFIIMVSSAAQVALRTIIIFFHAREECLSQNIRVFYAWTAGCQLIDTTILLWNRPESMGWLKTLRLVGGNLIVLLVLCLQVGGAQDEDNWAWLAIEAIALYFLYHRSSQIYASLRFTRVALQYEIEIKIVDLVMTLVMIVHTLAIVIYSVTKVNGNQQTWLQSASLDAKPIFVRYIYSFYFCATTILTVGYGDLSPKNPVEVVVVTFIQLFGIVFFAYLLNEIGYQISVLRKDKEQVEKDLTLIEQMKMQYRLEKGLVSRTRSYLINRQLEKKAQQIRPEQQRQIMLKLSESLRNEISIQSSLSLVKSCVFFLCRWSKGLQSSVASKLIHALYVPGQEMPQLDGKERIYIIRLGKVDVQTGRRGGRKGKKRVVKQIAVDKKKQVSDSCYGYTAVISHHKVRYSALSKDFTSAHYIEKDKFIESVCERLTDFEYYHQIKAKLQQNRDWQAYEIPFLSSSRHHYNPTAFNIIRKQYQDSVKARRVAMMRGDRRWKHPLIRQAPRVFKSTIKSEANLLIPSETDLKSYTKTSSNTGNPNASIKLRFEEKDQIQEQNSTLNSLDPAEEMDHHTYFTHTFESGREFGNFFTQQNKQPTLRAYDLSNARAPGIMHQIPLNLNMTKRSTLYEGHLLKLMEHEFFPLAQDDRKRKHTRRPKTQPQL